MATSAKAKTYQKTRNWLRLVSIGFTLIILIGAIKFGWSRLFYNGADLITGNRYGALVFYFLFFSLYSLVLSFPLEIYSDFMLERQYDLSNQTLAAWFWELMKKSLLSFGIMTPLVMLLYVLIC